MTLRIEIADCDLRGLHQNPRWRLLSLSNRKSAIVIHQSSIIPRLWVVERSPHSHECAYLGMGGNGGVENALSVAWQPEAGTPMLPPLVGDVISTTWVE